MAGRGVRSPASVCACGGALVSEKLIQSVVREVHEGGGLVCGFCAHGYYHPLYASVNYLHPDGERCQDCSHDECDGCCRTDAWRIEELEESIKRANGIIRTLQQRTVALRLMRAY